MKKYDWIIIGTSVVADRFAKVLQLAHQKLVGVIGTSDEKAKDFATRWGAKSYWTKKEDINIPYHCVYVASPNDTHYDYAKHFLTFNKHVLVEKPMTTKAEHTKELIALADRNHVKLMEDWSHLHPGKWKEYLTKGKELSVNFMQHSNKIKLGVEQQAYAFSKAHFGGVITDLGVYVISSALWLHGPITRFRILKYSMYKDVDIDVELELIHKNGAITKSHISKIADGDNAVYLDGTIISKHISNQHINDSLLQMLNIFLSNDYNYSHELSIEVAKIVTALKKALKTDIDSN